MCQQMLGKGGWDKRVVAACSWSQASFPDSGQSPPRLMHKRPRLMALTIDLQQSKNGPTATCLPKYVGTRGIRFRCISFAILQ